MRKGLMLLGWMVTVVATRAAGQEVVFDDAIRLSNGVIELAVSPKVGRIVHFGKVGGMNLLWVSPRAWTVEALGKGEWVNWGGDKVWPAVQAIWPRFTANQQNWPPEGVIDGQAWSVVEHDDRHVVIQSRVNEDLQVRVTRRIELDASHANVTIRNTIERVGPSVLPVMVWSVTQVRQPRYILMDVADDRPANEAAQPWRTLDNTLTAADSFVTRLPGDMAVKLTTSGDASLKVGTLGRWIAGVWDDVIFVQAARFDPAGSYPDRSCVQVYRDANYAELELLGPQAHPLPGQTIEHVVHWRLVERQGEIEPAVLAAELESMGASR